MKFRFKVDEILQLFPNSVTEGSLEIQNLKGIASLSDAEPGDLSFLGNLKYRNQVSTCKATIILVPLDYESSPQENQMFVKLEDPSYGLAVICKFLEEKIFPTPEPEIHPTAVVEETACVDISSSIGPFCYVGNNAKIGSNTRISSHCHIGADTSVGNDCRIDPGVKLLARCIVGDQVILNAGVVIGSEGYGFDHVGGENLKIPHLGIVIVEDKVEIGANTCIDRARFHESKIGFGTKIDNLVQVGHNVKIGKDCLIVAQVGISGSVKIHDQVIVGGQAGFAGHLTIGKGSRIAGQAGITKNVEPGAFLKGNPALPVNVAHRISVLQRKLPELFNRIAEIEAKK